MQSYQQESMLSEQNAIESVRTLCSRLFRSHSKEQRQVKTLNTSPLFATKLTG